MHCRWSAAGLQSEPARVAELRQFIEYAASLDDVWVVTNQQVCDCVFGVAMGEVAERGCGGGWLGRRRGMAAAVHGREWQHQHSPSPNQWPLRADPPVSPACCPVITSAPSPARLQLLAWMENPVPASRVDLQLKCDPPTDISPDAGPACRTFVG